MPPRAVYSTQIKPVACRDGLDWLLHQALLRGLRVMLTVTDAGRASRGGAAQYCSWVDPNLTITDFYTNDTVKVRPGDPGSIDAARDMGTRQHACTWHLHLAFNIISICHTHFSGRFLTCTGRDQVMPEVHKSAKDNLVIVHGLCSGAVVWSLALPGPTSPVTLLPAPPSAC